MFCEWILLLQCVYPEFDTCGSPSEAASSATMAHTDVDQLAEVQATHSTLYLFKCSEIEVKIQYNAYCKRHGD